MGQPYKIRPHPRRGQPQFVWSPKMPFQSPPCHLAHLERLFWLITGILSAMFCETAFMILFVIQEDLSNQNNFRADYFLKFSVFQVITWISVEYFTFSWCRKTLPPIFIWVRRPSSEIVKIPEPKKTKNERPSKKNGYNWPLKLYNRGE